MGGIGRGVGGDVSTAALRFEYAALERRLQIRWWLGRARRVIVAVARAVLYAAAIVFAVVSCSRAYEQVMQGMGTLHRP
jgi:hypothetical protein